MTLTPELADAIAINFVLPILCVFDKETSQRIQADIVLIYAEGVARREVQSNVSPMPQTAKGEVRIVIREAYHQDCFSFELESIFQGIAPGTGFSGIAIRGKFNYSNGQFSVKESGRSNRYNVWTWSDKFCL